MKFGLFKNMNAITIVLLTAFTIGSCGHKVIGEQKIIIQTKNISLMSLPTAIEQQPKINADSIKEQLIRPVKNIILDPVKDFREFPYDSLWKYNIKWQGAYLRLVDSNVARRTQLKVVHVQKDSALEIIRNMDKRDMQFQKDYRSATHASKSNTNASQLSEYSTQIMFFFILAVNILIYIKGRPKPNNHVVTV